MTLVTTGLVGWLCGGLVTDKSPQFCCCFQAKKEILAEIGRAKLSEAGKEGGRGNKKPLSTIDKPFDEPKHDTRAEIAKDLGW